jgi:serine/threonine protein kinase
VTDDDASATLTTVLTPHQKEEKKRERRERRKQRRGKEKPLYQLADFWFFHNPRKVGCSFSEGRADWGARHTAPPETEGNFKITDKSDVWALGVCLYSWATRGLPLPGMSHTDGRQFDFTLIAKTIPLKWGPWLNSLIKMCLQRNPKFRASAADLYQFLARS